MNGTTSNYDAIVVGARVAGSSTALQLARRGHRVLAVDRASFPSDTLSTHQVQVPGGARLARWGLLGRLIDAGVPAARRIRFDPGPLVLEGHLPKVDAVDAIYSPRRTVLDAMLVDAARDAGAEVRERFAVEEVLVEEGAVVGIRGRAKGGAPVTDRAPLVIGADGKRSMVAEAVGAPASLERPVRTMACYAYWSDVELDGGWMWSREGVAIGAWPTNDHLTMVVVALPLGRFEPFRADVEGTVHAVLAGAGELGERVLAGRRVERFRSSPDLPNRIRVPFGPGWALAGDAGLVMDPITGQGIGHAFRDAELIADAVDAWTSGRPFDEAFEAYRAARDAETRPMFNFTQEVAALMPPTPEFRLLLDAIAGRQDEVDRFLGLVTGSTPIPAYFAPANLRRLIGVRGMAKVALSRIRNRPTRAA
jgi:2-polyprenyl-6-methoxyphenol hydroxylase-like FAD-dependent oxidoreductase